ncbi:MAG TPA: hypothetical protein VHD90_14950 [Phototrophicaceae bacterium]|nr:hypothetical protein [Phototrophicaceae bacterium]
MTSEHEEWLERAAAAQRAKRYDEAREYAMRVVREDGRNAKALWIVATSTSSLSERRNALNMLLRVQPDNLPARQMLNAIDQERKATNEVKAVSATKATGEHKPISATKATGELKALGATKATAELKAVGASKATGEQKAVNAANTNPPAASNVIRPIKANNAPQGHFLLYTTVAVALLIIAATIAAAVTL